MRANPAALIPAAPTPAARGKALAAAGHALAPALLRLWTGSWPDGPARRQFADGFRTPSGLLPPLPRALNATAAADAPLARMLMQRMIDAGRLPEFAQHGPTAQAGNPLSFWEGPPLAFLHLEKTGGSALMAALAPLFHPLQIASSATVALSGQLADRTSLAPRDGGASSISLAGGASSAMRAGGAPIAPPADAARCQRPLLWGHFTLPELRALAPGHRLMTLLRKPGSRIVSLYHFWRSIRPEHLPALQDVRVEAAHACSFGAFLRLPDRAVRDSIDNVYVRRLADLPAVPDPADPLDRDPDAALGAARRALRDFAWIGVTHRFDDSLARLSAELGHRLEIPHKTANRREANDQDWPLLYRPVQAAALTAADEAALGVLTRLDDVLFADVMSMTGVAS